MKCPRCGNEMEHFDSSDPLGEHWTCFYCAGEGGLVVMIFPKERCEIQSILKNL